MHDLCRTDKIPAQYRSRPSDDRLQCEAGRKFRDELLALNNIITGRGPNDPELQRAWRSAGNEPYSIRIGDRWYGYNQIEPFGMLTGAVADSFGIMKFAKDEDRGNVAASLTFGIGQAMLSKTYLTGVASMFEALNDPDRQGDRFADNLITSMTVPQGVAAFDRATDDFVRAHYGLLDQIEARFPMVSKGLPPARTLWGDPIAQRDAFLPLLSDTGFARFVSPVSDVPVHAEPIDKWIWDNRASFLHGDQNDLGIRKAPRVPSYEAGRSNSTQVQLSPEQYDRFQVLAGNGIKDPVTGLGAKDYLNDLVAGTNPNASDQDQWNKASAPQRTVMVQSLVNKYRGAAKQQLLHEYPDIGESVRAGWAQRGAALQGQGGQP